MSQNSSFFEDGGVAVVSSSSSTGSSCSWRRRRPRQVKRPLPAPRRTELLRDVCAMTSADVSRSSTYSRRAPLPHAECLLWATPPSPLPPPFSELKTPGPQRGRIPHCPTEQPAQLSPCVSLSVCLSGVLRPYSDKTAGNVNIGPQCTFCAALEAFPPLFLRSLLHPLLLFFPVSVDCVG